MVSLLPATLGALCLALWLRGTFPLTLAVPWVPTAGVDLSLHIDGLALLFLLLITGIGTAVFVYASAYMTGQPGRQRLFALLSLFMLAMIGCVIADNLLTVFVFWELTSVISFLLVGFKHTYEGTRRAAQQAFMTTALGGLVMLPGMLILGHLADSYSVRAIIDRAPQLLAEPLLPAALVCLFGGAFTKSAQWPFHFWLPNAMAAPTPVSAYLHSATMVQLGVYLLARLKPAFGELPIWEVTLVTIGALTAVWSMVLTLRERDLKRILAWSTVSALGTLVLLIGLPGAGAAEATAALLLAHALYKAPLFFVAGNVDHCTGTRQIDDLAGMARPMPWTAAAALLAGLSMAGVPLSFGYVAKDLVNIAKVEGQAFEWVSYAVFAVSAVSVAVAAVAAIRVFWHRGGAPLPREVHEASLRMVAAPLLLAGTAVALGLVPSLSQSLLDGAASAMLPPGQALGLVIREGVSSSTGTLLTFAAGALVFLGWDRLHGGVERLSWSDSLGPAAWYAWLLKAFPAAARAVTTRLQHGGLAGYLAVTLAFFAATTTAALIVSPPFPWPGWTTVGSPVLGALALLVAAAFTTCLVRDPFLMVLVSGLVGMGTAIVCLFLGAPDVAFTQFTVEAAFVVVVAAVIARARRFRSEPERREPWRLRATLAAVVGTLVTILLVAASAGPLNDAIPRYYGERSVPDAHGRNVVNVIIVDFRAIDTLGEASVLAFALLSALPLLHGSRSARPRPRRDQ